MKKFSVFQMMPFWTGIIHFDNEEEILYNLEEIDLPPHVWECNDEGHENDILNAEYIAALKVGPGIGATFVNQPETEDFKNILHIQRNF